MYAVQRITVHLLVMLALAIPFGCGDSSHSVVPVSITRPTPFSYEGAIKRMWGGDNFEVFENGNVHFAYIRGIDTPKHGQYGHQEAQAWVREIANNNLVTIHVIERDELKREVCDLAIFDVRTNAERNVAVELLENGLAWFDQSEGPYSDSYREAEFKARKAKVGIWSKPNPTPPWEHWEKENRQLKQSLNIPVSDID